jgi:hypothetical protein
VTKLQQCRTASCNNESSGNFTTVRSAPRNNEFAACNSGAEAAVDLLQQCPEASHGLAATCTVQ